MDFYFIFVWREEKKGAISQGCLGQGILLTQGPCLGAHVAWLGREALSSLCSLWGLQGRLSGSAHNFEPGKLQEADQPVLSSLHGRTDRE